MKKSKLIRIALFAVASCIVLLFLIINRDSENTDPFEEPVDIDFEIYYNSKIPRELVYNVYLNRQYLFKEKGEIDFFAEYNPNLDNAVFEKCFSYQKSLDVLSQVQAKNDIDFLFDYLRVYYAGYEYFGGDLEFEKVKEELLYDIETNYSEISPTLLADLINEHLSGSIYDLHFEINGDSLLSSTRYKYFYYSDDFLFYKNGHDFFTDFDGTNYQLTEINGSSPENMLKLTISESGELRWMIAFTSSVIETSTNIEIVLFSSQPVTYNPQLKLAGSNIKGGYSNFFTIDKESTYPILHIDMMRSNTDNYEALIKETADYLHNEKLFLIDLRGNPGGSDIYPRYWMQIYTGISPIYSVGFTLRKNSLVGDYFQGYSDPGNLGWQVMAFTSFEPYRNANIVFVLIDTATASAAEAFISYLSCMDNVILVGTDTYGAYSGANNYLIRLPISGIPLICGNTLILDSDLSSIDGKGFSPDIWIPPDIAVNRITSFVQYYDLVPD